MPLNCTFNNSYVINFMLYMCFATYTRNQTLHRYPQGLTSHESIKSCLNQIKSEQADTAFDGFF